MQRFKSKINVLLPPNTKRRQLAKQFYGFLSTRESVSGTQMLSYNRWITEYEPQLFKDTANKLKKIKNSPLVTIVVPCYNTPRKYIKPLIDSIINQIYQNWELVLVDGSDDKGVLIRDLAKLDKRIVYKKIEGNRGIVGNTNAGISIAKGEFIGFLDHDDTLSKYALAEIVIALNLHPGTELLYSDEDKLSDNGKQRVLPFFKPDWSPELLLGVNYITHFVVAKKTLVDRLEGLRKGFDGAQDYDFLLRITEMTDSIVHIPRILYHWRLAEGSTAKTVGEKDYANTAGQRALRDAIKRRKISANVVEIKDRPTNYRLRFKLKKQPKVSIIIPFKDKPDLLRQCVGSIISKSTYKNYEIILVSNNSVEQETHALLDELKNNPYCKVFVWNHPFNYSKINNFGRKQATGEYLILLNNDTEVITPDWLEELIGVASQPGVGAVGPLLYYPDKTIQHAGIILGMKTMAGHVFRLLQPSDWTAFGLPSWPRNYLAVTGACLVINAKKYDEVGGLDEVFTVAGNDVALGICLHQLGYRNIYWPFAELIHYENVSVGSYNSVPRLDYDHSLTYYRPYLNWKDPYFNSNLDLMNEQVGLRSDYKQ